VRDRERVTLGMHPQNAELPFTWPGNDSDDERSGRTSIYRLIPSMQKFRGNLTALSQMYNVRRCSIILESSFLMLTTYPSFTSLLIKAEYSSTDPALLRARHSRANPTYNSSPKRVPWPG
jgi:hypothetical protein